MKTNANKPCAAVVLAAGLGKRMKSQLPKPLHDVMGKSILERVLGELDKLELVHVHLVLGHGYEQIEKFLQENKIQTPISFHMQMPQLGTGHALMQVVPALKKFSGTLLVMPGDTPLVQAHTLNDLIEKHRADNAVVSLLTSIVPDAKNYGRVVRNDSGTIEKVVEDKDATAEEKQIHEVNSSIYCLEWPEVESGLSSLTCENSQKEYYLTDLVAWAHRSQKHLTATCAADWQELAGINSRLELSEAIRLLRMRVVKNLAIESGVTVVDAESTWIAPEVQIGSDTTILPGCHITGDVQIGRNCQIGPHTVISGPAKIGNKCSVVQSLIVASQIGDNCRVGPFAHLREGANVSDSARIGNFVEIKKSKIGARTNVSHLSYVGDATIGTGANVGAGTITANYDHITKKKSQTIIGDGVSTGCNAVLVAPIEIGANATVAAGTVVTKDVPEDALVVGRARQEIKQGWSLKKRKQLEP